MSEITPTGTGRRWSAKTLSLWAFAASLVGCEVHQSGFDEPLDPPEAFAEEQDDGDRLPPPARWWTAFEDADLNELQRLALSDNFDLATFRDRVDAARAIVRRERSFLFPTLDFSLFAERTSVESDGNFESDSLFGGSLIGAYEVDLWKANESSVEGARFRRAIAEEELRAFAIALTADVARTWYALLEQRGQARVLEAQIRTNEDVLQVVRARFGGGVVRASDVLRQERLLESTREQRASVQGEIEVLEHLLLVLTGRSPTTEAGVTRDELPELPATPALGLPSELITRRPDIRSSYLAIRASDRDVAVAVADRYPSVTIGATASTSAEQIADLFDDWASTLSVDVLGPIFDAGRREAEVDRTLAIKAERINRYAQTVLQAFRQVVDALSRESARDRQITLLEKQLVLARRTSERLNREYLNGDISYIDVLDALTLEQRLQRDLLSARFQRINDRISLYQALAGGWEGILPTLEGDRPEMSQNGAKAPS